MTRYFLFILLIFCGCTNNAVEEYTKKHPGVVCSIDTNSSWANCVGGYYENGEYVPYICDHKFMCTDGTTIIRRF